MRKIKTLIAVLMVITMFTTLFVGCKKDDKADKKDTTVTTDSGDKGGTKDATDAASKEVREYSMFIAMTGNEVPDSNRLLNKIKEKTGAWAKMTYLTGQTADERIGVMVAGGEYPDFIVGSTGTPALMEADALIAIDDYWDAYPNIKNFLTESEWNRIRATSEDGKIYLIPQFGIVKGKDMQTYHNDEAFWIQKQVLVWDNYPTIRTMDQYFDLIERYLKAHPKTDDGQDTIGFSMSSEDWRYFGIENGPLFISGYPNDGACIVDPVTHEAIDYNTIPEAKIYYQKMNEAFNRGLVYPETYTLSFDQYSSLIASGRILGIIDQYWNFGTSDRALRTEGKYGQTYVPLPVTLSEDIVDRWHNYPALDVSNGLSITTSCKDIEGALQFVNDLLDPEILKMRYWGEEGVDYYVGDDGVFYRDETQRANALNQNWDLENFCKYDYFPRYSGMLEDGINAFAPDQQPGEYYAGLPDYDKEFLDGYGYKTMLDFLTADIPNEPWFPMWSYTNTWTQDTPHGAARQVMTDLKHEWLPKTMMCPADQFDSLWDQYMATYKDKVDVDAYLDELTDEINRRVAIAEGK